MDQTPNMSPPPAVWPPPPTNTVSIEAEASPLAALDSFRVQNIWLVLFLTIITFGIYAVFWLRRQTATLAQVRPDLNVTLVYGNIVLVFVILSAGLDIASLIGLPASLDTDSNILDRIVGIMVLVLAFQVRNGLNLLQAQKSDVTWFSGVYTWLFNVVYLQYKINKNIRIRQAELLPPAVG